MHTTFTEPVTVVSYQMPCPDLTRRLWCQSPEPGATGQPRDVLRFRLWRTASVVAVYRADGSRKPPYGLGGMSRHTRGSYCSDWRSAPSCDRVDTPIRW